MCYTPSLKGPFLWDDEALVVTNSFIRDWRLIPSFFSFSAWPTEDAHSFYRPVQMISYAFDYSFWKLNPFGYHLTNVALHVGIGILLFFFIQLIVRNYFSAWMSSLLFAVHPLHTEAVSYISGRADLLAAFFILLTMIFYWYSLHAKGYKAWIFTAGVILFFLCALGSKEISAFVILLFPALFFILPESDKRVAGVTTLVCGALLTAYIFLRSYFAAQSITYDIFAFSFGERVLLALRVFALYFVKIIAPLALHMEYIVLPPESVFSAVFLASALFLLSFIGVLALALHKSKAGALGLIWYLIFLVPVLNLVPINATFSEHWVYIPLLGLALSVSAFSVRYKERLTKKRGRVFFVLWIVFLLFFSGRTILRSKEWADPILFYAGILKYAPNNIKVRYNLGNEFLKRKSGAQAIKEYEAVIATIATKQMVTQGAGSEKLLKRLLAKTYNNLGNAYRLENNYESARQSYQKSLAVNPAHELTHKNLVSLYVQYEEFEEAAKHRTIIEEFAKLRE
jgi:hypothetical protein